MGKTSKANKSVNLSLKNTMITAEMSTKIEEVDYMYYRVDEGILPPPDAYFFEPDEDDIMLSKDDKNWQRLIFAEDDEYRDFEEEKYEELEDYMDKNNIIIPSNVCKSDIRRFLQANHYKPNKTVEDLLAHLEWRKQTLPIILTSDQKMFLDEGLFYIHGRDRSYRPLCVFDPRIIIGKTADRDEVIMIVHFVFNYMMTNMLIPGKIENWTCLLDLSNLSINQLPKKWLTAFIKSCQANYKCRGVKSFVLNASWGIRAVWRVAQVFVDSKVKQKIGFYDSSSPDDLVKMFHPSQLEKKFGGEADNLDVYWPPHEISKEYGVEPDKIIKPKTVEYDDSADVDIDDEEDSIHCSHQLNSSLILSDSIVMKNKLNPIKIAEIKVEDVKVSLEDAESPLKISRKSNPIVLENSPNGKRYIYKFIMLLMSLKISFTYL